MIFFKIIKIILPVFFFFTYAEAQEGALDFCRLKVSSPDGYGSYGKARFCEKNFSLPSPYLYECLSSQLAGFKSQQERVECDFFFSNMAEYTQNSFNLSEWGTSLWGPWYDFEVNQDLKNMLIFRFKKIKKSVKLFKENKYEFLLKPLKNIKVLSQGELVGLAICKKALNDLNKERFKKYQCEQFNVPSVEQVVCLKESSAVQDVSSAKCKEVFEAEGVGPWYDYILPGGLGRVAVEVGLILSRK